MGSGEFDGGGSVDWRIVHGDGDHGQGNQGGGKGKDKHPKKGDGGEFIVKLNGITKFTAPLDTSHVLVLWDIKPGYKARKAKTAKAKKTTKHSK